MYTRDCYIHVVVFHKLRELHFAVPAWCNNNLRAGLSNLLDLLLSRDVDSKIPRGVQSR